MSYYDGETFERNGLSFKVETQWYASSETPWEREDGHGPVSDWRTSRDYTGRVSKEPGERVLIEDRGSARFYDFKRAVAIARKDGWGLSEKSLASLTAKLGREPKAGDIAAQAAEDDYDRLRRFCDSQWGYVGVVVTLLDVNGEPTDRTISLWGIESDADDYLTEVAHELADEIAHDVGEEDEIVERHATWRIREAVEQ